jgi:hypothetical protein
MSPIKILFELGSTSWLTQMQIATPTMGFQPFLLWSDPNLANLGWTKIKVFLTQTVLSVHPDGAFKKLSAHFNNVFSKTLLILLYSCKHC